jgi:predicted ABC-type ATPase
MYIIAGCNGAGKTTASLTVLPEMLDCTEFVNADEIARGLNPLHPESVFFKSGKLLIQRIDELIAQKATFAVESTISGVMLRNKIIEAKNQGYIIALLYFWLQNLNLAKQRVKTRVQEGGHSVDDTVIERRYVRGIKNLFEVFLPIADVAMLFDNSELKADLIAEKTNKLELNILNETKYNKLISYLL